LSHSARKLVLEAGFSPGRLLRLVLVPLDSKPHQGQNSGLIILIPPG
jgi:hypothetical protein